MSGAAGGPGLGFPPSARLRKRREYLAIQGSGARQFTKHFMLFIADGGTAETRLGITASKKVGNAVVRNRWKRVTRDAFRHLRPRLAGRPVMDVVVVARKGVEPPASAVARTELWSVLRRGVPKRGDQRRNEGRRGGPRDGGQRRGRQR